MKLLDFQMRQAIDERDNAKIIYLMAEMFDKPEIFELFAASDIKYYYGIPCKLITLHLGNTAYQWIEGERKKVHAAFSSYYLEVCT